MINYEISIKTLELKRLKIKNNVDQTDQIIQMNQIDIEIKNLELSHLQEKQKIKTQEITTLNKLKEIEDVKFEDDARIEELQSSEINQLYIRKLNIHNELSSTIKEKAIIETKLDELRATIVKLNEERLENLNKISQCLFNSDYTNNENKFVFFKFYDNVPSILNRLWIETDTKCICIYPKQQGDPNGLSKFNYDTLLSEKHKIASCLNLSKPVYFSELDVPKSNPEKPEGGPHCLFKQQFVHF